ncbi:hypothetical protein [Priestia koreensis]|uniref:hypothetical protein n=1 Tax=Priestia koreensis TaxID=284581 RepID=UPI00203E3053|nr:hypothetical protein [Priestia koreensis]MCM3003069.1 hypothetical protein [Priestia koreensis]
MNVYILSTFEYTTQLEMALSEIEQVGIDKSQIAVVRLDHNDERGQVADSFERFDGTSYIDLAAIFGTIFMLLGVIYGHILYLGPILWGIIGLLIGGGGGFIADYLYTKRKVSPKRTHQTEVIVIIECNYTTEKAVRRILAANQSKAIGQL